MAVGQVHRCFCYAGSKPSWTAKLLANPQLLCKKVQEEAGELCQTLEADEGKERAASEAADLIYHAMVLLNAQVHQEGSAAVHLHLCNGTVSDGMFTSL